jgi:hypothetical protein
VIDVEGYTAEDPIGEEDWRDEVQWVVETHWSDRRTHDADGYICEMAGSDRCLDLGHIPDPVDGWWSDDEAHPVGWSGDPICPATRLEDACTVCEGPVSECESAPTDTAAFWRLFSTPRGTP